MKPPASREPNAAAGAPLRKPTVAHTGAATAIALLAATPLALAQQYPVGSSKGVDGKAMFEVCAFCHGPQGQGGQALDAPPLAGMESWYVARQLDDFKERRRGTHPDDVTGLQMSIVAGMTKNSATIANLAAYIQALPSNPSPETINGAPAGTARPFNWRSKYASLVPARPADAAKGAALYKAGCASCHADKGQGNRELGAPRLSHLPDWYLHRELRYYRDGLRGTDPADTFGLQMAASARTLPDEQAIADVVSYIETLRGE